MTYSTQMNEIIEERYRFCIWLNLIKKETDKRNKEKKEQGEENLVYMGIFTKPCHIKNYLEAISPLSNTHIFTL